MGNTKVIVISHRGNIGGPNHGLENHPEQIKKAQQDELPIYQRDDQINSKYHGCGVEYLLNELVAWLNDPLDQSEIAAEQTADL